MLIACIFSARFDETWLRYGGDIFSSKILAILRGHVFRLVELIFEYLKHSAITNKNSIQKHSQTPKIQNINILLMRTSFLWKKIELSHLATEISSNVFITSSKNDQFQVTFSESTAHKSSPVVIKILFLTLSLLKARYSTTF